MSLKQISAKIPESLRTAFYKKCDDDGQIWTVTLALILDKFLEEEYSELWEEEGEGE